MSTAMVCDDCGKAAVFDNSLKAWVHKDTQEITSYEPVDHFCRPVTQHHHDHRPATAAEIARLEAKFSARR